MPARPKTSLRGLRTFCVAARHESFTQAADELFITASAVSHQVKGLEQELDVQLFVRGSRELKLTETGKAFFDEVEPLIERLDAIAGSYRKDGPSRSIRISVQPFFASEYFVPRLSEFTAEHPNIDIQVGTSDESSEKHPADVDLSVRLFKSPPENLASHLLFPLRMVPTGSPDFKKNMVVRKKKIVTEFPLIVHETRPKAWKRWSKDSGIALPKDSKVTRLDSMIAVVRAAERGIGAALVPVPLADQWFKQGSIVRLFRNEFVADVSYYLVYRKERAGDPDVCLLRDWILQKFADST
ncbi:MAG: LysR substrate-binding domain-containing protein [Woeseiaceae bacterium]|nr:LysR substrate-binding domain-containing protein [Woeseiaceae bacterium]